MLYKPSFAWYIYSYSANGCIFASSLVCACIQFRSAEIFSVRRDTEGSEILIYFNCDYTEGCHPNILKRLCETNMMQTVGYGEDEICDLARAKIRKACGREDVDVHFARRRHADKCHRYCSDLRPHQGALSADTGHINVHETGAVEATGHKVLPLSSTPERQDHRRTGGKRLSGADHRGRGADLRRRPADLRLGFPDRRAGRAVRQLYHDL